MSEAHRPILKLGAMVKLNEKRVAFEGSFLDALMSPFEALYTDILKKDNFRKERFITLGEKDWGEQSRV